MRRFPFGGPTDRLPSIKAPSAQSSAKEIVLDETPHSAKPGGLQLLPLVDRRFPVIVRLNRIRRMTKVSDCTLHKVYRAVAAGFLAGADKPFPASFLYYVVSLQFRHWKQRMCLDRRRKVG